MIAIFSILCATIISLGQAPVLDICESSQVMENIEVVEEVPYLPSLSESDMALIGLVTMAEAEGEPEYGKRLVIDTILNRVDSPYYPDTVSGVIYQKGQFSSMWNGRVNRTATNDYVEQLVLEELESRQNYDVIYFTAGRYSKYGTPMFVVGNHYFSGY